MTIEITVSQLLNSTAAITEIMRTKIPSQIAYLFSRAIKKIEPELKIYEDIRAEAIKKYGKDNGKGGIEIKLDDKAAIAAFNAEINPILETKISMDIEPIDIKLLGDVLVEPGVFMDFDWFFKEGE